MGPEHRLFGKVGRRVGPRKAKPLCWAELINGQRGTGTTAALGTPLSVRIPLPTAAPWPSEDGGHQEEDADAEAGQGECPGPGRAGRG